MQAHDDDGDAGDDRELVGIEPQQPANRAGAGAERDEHGREPGDEQRGGEQHVALDQRRRLGAGQPLHGGAREIDQIGRHQRQHAGRQEADQPANSAARMETSAAMAPRCDGGRGDCKRLL